MKTIKKYIYPMFMGLGFGLWAMPCSAAVVNYVRRDVVLNAGCTATSLAAASSLSLISGTDEFMTCEYSDVNNMYELKGKDNVFLFLEGTGTERRIRVCGVYHRDDYNNKHRQARCVRLLPLAGLCCATAGYVVSNGIINILNLVTAPRQLPVGDVSQVSPHTSEISAPQHQPFMWRERLNTFAFGLGKVLIFAGIAERIVRSVANCKQQAEPWGTFAKRCWRSWRWAAATRNVSSELLVVYKNAVPGDQQLVIVEHVALSKLLTNAYCEQRCPLCISRHKGSTFASSFFVGAANGLAGGAFQIIKKASDPLPIIIHQG